MIGIPWPDLLEPVASSVLPPQYLFANTFRPSTFLARQPTRMDRGSMTTIFKEFSNPDAS